MKRRDFIVTSGAVMFLALLKRVTQASANSFGTQGEYFGEEILIKSAESGLSLVPFSATANKEGGKVVLADVKGKDRDQRWELVRGKHGILIKNAQTGLYLVPPSATADKPGSKVVLAPVDGNDVDQNWKIQKTKHGFLLKNAKTGLSLVPPSATVNEPNSKVVLADVEGNDRDQNWVFQVIE